MLHVQHYVKDIFFEKDLRGGYLAASTRPDALLNSAYVSISVDEAVGCVAVFASVIVSSAELLATPSAYYYRRLLFIGSTHIFNLCRSCLIFAGINKFQSTIILS